MATNYNDILAGVTQTVNTVSAATVTAKAAYDNVVGIQSSAIPNTIQPVRNVSVQSAQATELGQGKTAGFYDKVAENLGVPKTAAYAIVGVAALIAGYFVYKAVK